MAARKHWNRFWSGVAAVGVWKCVVFLYISPYGRCNFLITSHMIVKIYFFFVFIWWVKGDLRPFQETRNLSTASWLMCLKVSRKVSWEQWHTRLGSVFQEKFGLFGSDRTNILLLKHVQHHYPAASLTLLKRVGVQSSSSSRDELVSTASFLGCSGLTASPTSYWEIIDCVCVMLVSRLCGPKAVWVPVRKRRAKAAPFQTALTRPSPAGSQRSHEQPQRSQTHTSIGNSQRKYGKTPQSVMKVVHAVHPDDLSRGWFWERASTYPRLINTSASALEPHLRIATKTPQLTGEISFFINVL